jgi:hypothetical protein
MRLAWRPWCGRVVRPVRQAWRSESVTLRPPFGTWPRRPASRRCCPTSDAAPEGAGDARPSPAGVPTPAPQDGSAPVRAVHMKNASTPTAVTGREAVRGRECPGTAAPGDWSFSGSQAGPARCGRSFQVLDVEGLPKGCKPQPGCRDKSSCPGAGRTVQTMVPEVDGHRPRAPPVPPECDRQPLRIDDRPLILHRSDTW